MRTYNANDIQQLFDAQSHLAQFYVVAHTNICPARLSAKTLHTRIQAAKQDLRHTLNVLAAALHPNQSNLVRRKPHLYRPLAQTTLNHCACYTALLLANALANCLHLAVSAQNVLHLFS
jgi:hypothetical protein